MTVCQLQATPHTIPCAAAASAVVVFGCVLTSHHCLHSPPCPSRTHALPAARSLGSYTTRRPCCCCLVTSMMQQQGMPVMPWSSPRRLLGPHTHSPATGCCASALSGRLVVHTVPCLGCSLLSSYSCCLPTAFMCSAAMRLCLLCVAQQNGHSCGVVRLSRSHVGSRPRPLHCVYELTGTPQDKL